MWAMPGRIWLTVHHKFHVFKVVILHKPACLSADCDESGISSESRRLHQHNTIAEEVALTGHTVRNTAQILQHKNFARVSVSKTIIKRARQRGSDYSDEGQITCLLSAGQRWYRGDLDARACSSHHLRLWFSPGSPRPFAARVGTRNPKIWTRPAKTWLGRISKLTPPRN